VADETATATRYKLSFTSGALLMREAVVAAPLYLRERDWSKARLVIEDDNLMQARTVASGRRVARETVQRLAVLTDEEIELLVDATATERGHLLWAAACRRYDLIGEFAEEVVRERFLLLTSTLRHEDFDSFVRGKTLWHSELAELKESTGRKLRANVFRMLHEAGLLSDGGHILQAVLSQRVASALAARTPSDVRFFPATDDATGRTGR
jgi:BrxA